MFIELKKKIQENLKKMVKTGTLFHIEVDRDRIWELYLESFPDDGTRQHHNCNCCKSFLRQFSGIVAIDSNMNRITLWDNIDIPEYENTVKTISEYLKTLPITNRFVTTEVGCGTDNNFDINKNVQWDHFYVKVPTSCVVNKDRVATIKGDFATDAQMLERAFTELTEEACETVLELIDQNSLYRGSEFKQNVSEFVKELKKFKKVPEESIGKYLWKKASELKVGVIRLRNTAIGTLLIDLSEGMELDRAVTRFEKVVAPTNYKRPTALVTPKMIEEARKTLSENGLLESLERRYAKETDIPIEQIIYTNNDTLVSDVFTDMEKDIQVSVKKFSKVEEITIDDFINKVVPKAKNIHLLMENKHLNNMVSLLTAENPESPTLFKWDNHFSWNYTGGITDSIKERVKKAGGAVTGELRVSLSWSNYDDLDLHLHTPNGGIIYFGYKDCVTTKGKLDVDMNVSPTTREPVENIIFPSVNKMIDGVYRVKVHNYTRRENQDTGFTIQVECRGEVHEYTFNNNPKGNQYQHVVDIHYTKADGIVKLSAEGSSTTTVKDMNKWGLTTNRFHKVRKIMLSPNHWNKPTGNKHYIFTLEGCVSDETPRGFFNEFIRDDLMSKHKRVFEILGGKTKVKQEDNQVSGLGFSETMDNSFYVKVQGAFERVLKVRIK